MATNQHLFPVLGLPLLILLLPLYPLLPVLLLHNSPLFGGVWSAGRSYSSPSLTDCSRPSAGRGRTRPLRPRHLTKMIRALISHLPTNILTTTQAPTWPVSRQISVTASFFTCHFKEHYREKYSLLTNKSSCHVTPLEYVKLQMAELHAFFKIFSV